MATPKWERVRTGLAYTWWESWTTPDWGWTPCQELSDMDKDLLFFPPPQDVSEKRYHKRKLVDPICGECPVRQECGEYAIQAGIPHGWWGGMDPQERTAIRRERAGGRLHGDRTTKGE